MSFRTHPGVFACLYLCAAASQAQPVACSPPLCVNRADDSVANPVPGMLRYAVGHAPRGATITFDPALDGQSIALDTASPNNHILITQDLTIQGLGAKRLTVSGGQRTRIFLILGGRVMMTGLTLAEGLAQGGNGGAGNGGAGGGGGAAGLGGAIFVDGAALSLDGVILKGNRAVGGAGGAGGASTSAGAGGGGGGFAGPGLNAPSAQGGPAGDLAAKGHRNGMGGAGGKGEVFASSGQDAGWGAGGGGGALTADANGGAGGLGGQSDFGGGAGGPAGFFDADGNSTLGRAGSGGAALGGAIFVSSGLLQLSNTLFQDNSCTGGVGFENGLAKGGALAVCSAPFCGSGHDAAAVVAASTSFQGNSADGGGDQTCPGRDDVDVCGHLSASRPVRFQITGPPTFPSGEPCKVSVTALDNNNHLVVAYSGTVQIASSDPNAMLPADATLANGISVFAVTLKTPGPQSITASEIANASISGSAKTTVVTGDEALASACRSDFFTR